MTADDGLSNLIDTLAGHLRDAAGVARLIASEHTGRCRCGDCRAGRLDGLRELLKAMPRHLEWFEAKLPGP